MKNEKCKDDKEKIKKEKYMIPLCLCVLVMRSCHV